MAITRKKKASALTAVPDIKEAKPRPEVIAAVDQMNPEFLPCRDYGHAWRNYGHQWIPAMKHYRQVLKCVRCTTQRERFLTRSGALINAVYDYAEGYQLIGLGRLSSRDRDAIRLRSLQYTPVVEESDLG